MGSGNLSYIESSNLYYYAVESCFPAKIFNTQGTEETEVLIENGISRVT